MGPGVRSLCFFIYMNGGPTGKGWKTPGYQTDPRNWPQNGLKGLWVGRTKILRCLGAESKIQNSDEQQTVYQQFKRWVKDAQRDMEPDPGKRKPPRPIVASEQIYPTDNRHQVDESHPNDVVLKRALRFEIDEVKSECEYTRCHIETTDDDHSDWTFVHGIRRTLFHDIVRTRTCIVKNRQTLPVTPPLTPLHRHPSELGLAYDFTA